MNIQGELFRGATATDLDALVVLEQLCYAYPWSRQQFAAELDNPVASIDLLVGNGGICGYLCSWLICSELQILNLATSPHSRRRGVGRRLLEEVLRRALATGMSSAWLEVREGNAAAIALYHSCGFIEQGRRRRYYPDGEDALLLSREFAPPGDEEKE
jgi:ribosomal-protein-alanine N-acetyltransferase